MESTTYLRDIKIPPKKLRIFMPVIRNSTPVKVLEVLKYIPNRAAKLYYKAIHSAMANARQTLKVSDDLLQFKLLSVDAGQVLKRFNPGSHGNAKPYKKRYSHIKIVLQVKPSPPEKKIIVEEKPSVKPKTVAKAPAKKKGATK